MWPQFCRVVPTSLKSKLRIKAIMRKEFVDQSVPFHSYWHCFHSSPAAAVAAARSIGKHDLRHGFADNGHGDVRRDRAIHGDGHGRLVQRRRDLDGEQQQRDPRHGRRDRQVHGAERDRRRRPRRSSPRARPTRRNPHPPRLRSIRPQRPRSPFRRRRHLSARASRTIYGDGYWREREHGHLVGERDRRRQRDGRHDRRERELHRAGASRKRDRHDHRDEHRRHHEIRQRLGQRSSPTASLPRRRTCRSRLTRSLRPPRQTSAFSSAPTPPTASIPGSSPRRRGGGPVTILVAGMKMNTAYHMRANVIFADGTQFNDIDHTFTTGTVPAANLPTITVTTPTAGAKPQAGRRTPGLAGCERIRA